MSGPSRKAVLRERMRRELAALDAAEILRLSARIRIRVLELPEVRAARSVFVYVSFGPEPDTRELIDALLAAGCSVSVPVITGPGEMEAHRIRSRDELTPGPFGILAPRRRALLPGSPEVCLCPGLAFSETGERLGRGKAYYDRFLAAHPSAFAAGLAFECQIANDVPTEATDRRLRAIVTPDRVIRP